VKEGKARNTVRLRIAPVKALLATAHEEGLIRANPAAGLRLGRTVAAVPVKETHALSEQEIVRVLAEIPERHRLLVELLAQTGLRISEALALTKADVDFGRRRLCIQRRLADGDMDAPKTRYGVGQVPLSPGLARQLWTRLATADEGALVFATSTGGPLDRSKVFDSRPRACRTNGTRARRSCSGAACRRKRSAGCLDITRGTSRPVRTCISTTMTFPTAQSSATSQRRLGLSQLTGR
jgi:integrase